MMSFFIGFLFLIVFIAGWLFIMYWAIKKVYEFLKPKFDQATEQQKKMALLEERIERLERKLENS